MLLELHHDVQIARRPAVSPRLSFISQAKARARIDTGWNIDLQFAFCANITLAAALGARPANNLATPATLPAGPADLQKTLLVDHLAPPMAHRATHQPVILLSAASQTTGTALHAGNLDIHT